jgi:conjugal transfer pilus assembly protein TraW
MRLIFALFLTLLTTWSIGQSSVTEQGEAAASGEFLRRSQRIIEQAIKQTDRDLSQTDPRNIELADRIAKQAPAVANSQVSIKAEKFIPPSLGEHRPAVETVSKFDAQTEERSAFIFVSNSMTDDELKDAFEAAALYKTPVLFRGVLKGLSLEKTYMRTFTLAKGIEGLPGIQIDPRPFEFFGVTTVPTVVVWQGNDFVKVSGTLSVSYATKKFEAAQFGDAGSRGTTRDIIEPDLIEEMKERVSKIDFEAKKDAAISRFWLNTKLHPLPTVTESKVTYFDPTVINEDEIRDPNGNLIAPGGSSFNPLDLVSFSKVVVVFDATDKKQLDFAKLTADREFAANKGVILMTTNVDRPRGWEAMTEYSKFLFPHRVFVLDDLVAGRFGITAAPSVVRQSGRMFEIQQIAISELK